MTSGCIAAALLMEGSLHAAEGGASSPESAARPAIGDKIGPLTFTDIRYLPRTLSDLATPADPAPRRAFVLVFTNTTCPLVQRYLPRLKALEEEFRTAGVQFVAVNVGPNDSIADMAAQGVEFDVPFPFVKDKDHSVTAACGVRRTPEVVLLDAEHRLRYRGRIDNAYRLGGTAPGQSSSELRDAIRALIAGEEIAVAETPVDGCLITAPTAAKPTAKFNYADVAPLVERHCTSCHRPGTSAPFALESYDDLAAHGEMIAEVVEEGRMPPWYAAKGIGAFTNDRTMPKSDRVKLLDWIASGMAPGEGAAGDDQAAPAAGDSAHDPADPWAGQTWQIDAPDLVLQVPFTYDVPADGYVDYKYALLPMVFLRDTWLEQVEIQPSNPRVVHHANLGYLPIGATGMYARMITGYVPGVGPMKLEHNVASKIPPGSALGMQIHLTTTGKPEKVRLRVGFRFPREKVQKELHYLQLSNQEFEIPPYASHHPVSRTKTIDDDATLVGFFAHMHVRGKDMTFRAFPPDGDPVNLLMIPNYSFDWQLPYHLPYGEVKFPGGTRYEALAHFDNSTFNPYNPDPSSTVRDGQQTFQEMMYGFMFYTKDHEQLDLEIDTKTGQAKD